MQLEITSGDNNVASVSQRYMRIAQLPHSSGRLRALREAEDDAHAILSFLVTGMVTHAIDLTEALWIIDLAPGDGERAWRVLKHLSERAPRAPPIRYLACCLTPEHYQRLVSHRYLQPLIANGRLSLDRDGKGLPSHRVCNPIVVLAHEGFSARAQCVYAAHFGELFEAWSDHDGKIDWRAISQRDGMMPLLAAYRQPLGSSTFTLPRGGMEILSDLLGISGGRLLLRASDLGAGEIVQIRKGLLDPSLSGRTTASRLPVNFEALARWHRANGGAAHQMQRDDDGRVLHVALHDAADGRLQECLPDVLGLPHPDDHVQILLALDALSTMSPAQCLAVLHAHAGDQRALLALSRQILAAAPALTGTALAQWRDMLAYCSAQYYPPCEEDAVDNGLHEDIPALIARIASSFRDASQPCEAALVRTIANKDSLPT